MSLFYDISLIGGAVIIVLIIAAIILNWGSKKPSRFRIGFFVEREYDDEEQDGSN